MFICITNDIVRTPFIGVSQKVHFFFADHAQAVGGQAILAHPKLPMKIPAERVQSSVPCNDQAVKS